MTLDELKTITQDPLKNSFLKELEISIHFSSINAPIQKKGILSIFEYIESQYSKWKELRKKHSYFSSSFDYFNKLRDSLENFCHIIVSENNNGLTSRWNSMVNTNNYLSNQVFPADCPLAKFLVELLDKQPEEFDAAYNFLLNINNGYTINSTDKLAGALKALQFEKKTSKIAQLAIDAHEKSATDSYTTISNIINNANEESTKAIDSINQLLDSKKQEIEESIEGFNTSRKVIIENILADFSNLEKTTREKMTDIAETYDKLLSLKKPAEYWSDRAKTLKTDGKNKLYLLIGMIVLGIILLFTLLVYSPDEMLKSIFGEDSGKAIRWSIVFIAFLSLLGIGIRYLIKITFSTFHLARDAEERVCLTYVYLAMSKDSEIKDSDRQLIIQSLFSRADTGLLKDDSSPTMPGIGGILEKFTKTN